MSKKHNLGTGNEYLLVQGSNSFLLIGKAGTDLCICIETTESEYCQGLSPDDLIVVSAPEGGLLEPAIMLLELVRTYRCPLLVLPKGHPGSKRLRYVVSVGDIIRLSCSIERGTHPEQDVLCVAGEFTGLILRAVRGGVIMEGREKNYTVSLINYSFPTIPPSA
ncbi:MAG: alpha/beta hydrolase [Methanomicrobiales archaeon]